MNDIQASLSALLKALGEGVTQSSKLPTDDAFEFEKSFPEFAHPLSAAQCEWVRVLRHVLDEMDDDESRGGRGDGNEDEDVQCDYDIYDAAFWERCEEACEYLLDQMELDMNEGGSNNNNHHADATRNMLNQLGKRAQAHGNSAFSNLQAKLVDMIKPQITYRMRPAHNSRIEPFVPPLTSKPNAIVPLDLSLQEGHGLEGRFPVREASSSGGGGGGGVSSMSYRYAGSPHLVAPAHHVSHPYQVEIQQFVYRDDQLEVPASTSFTSKFVPRPSGPLQADWIDTSEQLQVLVQELQSQSSPNDDRPRIVIAIDLEAHGWRTFAGMTCLMQLSYKSYPVDSGSRSLSPTIHNYLIDTLQLQSEMQLLLPILTNPSIVKVMHGADSDVLWLQRDFGLYIVNLFDTGRAARQLQLPSASYAHLLHKYVGITADKSHQLADWRQRPLPTDMQQYAIQDTHYLLDIYDRLRCDLATKERITAVLDVSRLVCLSRYAVEPFDPDGYVVLMSSSQHSRRGGGNKSNSNSRSRQELDEAQERVLRRLWDWRDQVARDQDESVNYVCPKSALMRLALASHQLTSLRSLQSLFNPMPSPMILQYADEIIGMVQDELKKSKEPPPKDPKGEQASNETSAAANAASSPARADADDDEMRSVMSSKPQQPTAAATSSSFGASAFLVMKGGRNGGMSPVLGTEALYRQAGWVTPHEKLRALAAASSSSAATSSASAGEQDNDPTVGQGRSKPRHGHGGVSLHASNKNYQAGSDWDGKAASDPTKLGDGKSASRTVDGMATVRAALGGDAALLGDSNLEDELKRAKQNSNAVQAKLRGSLPSVLGLVTPVIDLEEDDTGIEDGRESRTRDSYGARDGARDEEDFVIPRSMREIYTISNRNRRNKKAGSPTPERGVTPTTEKEREELARAEALLKEHGLLPSPYFDDGTSSPGKKARTKSSTTSSGRESEETVPQDSAAMASRDDDFAVLKSIGWLPEGAAPATAPGKADGGGGDPTKNAATFGVDFASVLGQGSADSKQAPVANPFFAGAALVGGPLTQGFTKPDPQQQRSKKPNSGGRGGGGGGGKQQQGGRRQERPKKEEGRTHAYRKR